MKLQKLQKVDLSGIAAEIPPVLFRNHPKFKEIVGMSPRSIANLDCLGQGPRQRIMVGRVVGYPRQALIEFMTNRAVCYGE